MWSVCFSLIGSWSKNKLKIKQTLTPKKADISDTETINSFTPSSTPDYNWADSDEYYRLPGWSLPTAGGSCSAHRCECPHWQPQRPHRLVPMQPSLLEPFLHRTGGSVLLFQGELMCNCPVFGFCFVSVFALVISNICFINVISHSHRDAYHCDLNAMFVHERGRKH